MRTGLGGRYTGRTAAVLGAALALAGCTSGTPSPNATTGSTVAPPTTSVVKPAAQITPGTVQDLPNMGDGFTGIAKDVKLEGICPLDPGKFTLKGTVTNSAGEARDLQVAYVWLPEGSGDTLARGVVNLKNVKAGETKNWSMEIELKQKARICTPLARANKVGTLK